MVFPTIQTVTKTIGISGLIQTINESDLNEKIKIRLIGLKEYM